jgi:tRNA uridine 5-carboxymethylaminomethyl modification enzyme
MVKLLSSYPNLSIVEGSAEDLLLEGAAVKGVVLKEGGEVRCGKVVITTGTFLRGKCHLGRTSYPAGRHMRGGGGGGSSVYEVEPPSVGLAVTLERVGFPLSRMKTGTPPRLLAKSIDFSLLEPQPSDLPPPPFSYLNIERGVRLSGSLVPCHKTFTNTDTHALALQHRAEYQSRVSS